MQNFEVLTEMFQTRVHSWNFSIEYLLNVHIIKALRVAVFMLHVCSKSTTPFTRFFVTYFAGFRRVGDITVFSDDLFRYCVDLGVARQLSF